MAITGEFHEDDKLGPIGSATAVLHSDTELRALLVHEFREAAEAARLAALKTEAGTTHAVHEARKALRRGRAVLELLADALPKSERRAVKKALQEARRALSTVRDHAVAPDTLGALTLDDEDRATGKKVLDNAAEAMPAVAEIKQLLIDSAGRAAAQIEALEASLPNELGWSTVGVGLRNVYRAARDARKKAKHSAKAFHAWRRRAKELVYQLQLLADHAGGRTKEIHGEVAGVTEVLSTAVDLIMLHEFVETYGQGIAPEAIKRLQHTIDTQLDQIMGDARKAAADPFRAKAKQFSKRVGKAVRRDLAPAAPPVENPQGD
jgi:CHAD domain-containing protein